MQLQIMMPRSEWKSLGRKKKWRDKRRGGSGVGWTGNDPFGRGPGLTMQTTMPRSEWKSPA
jgi:hypothetical protein